MGAAPESTCEAGEAIGRGFAKAMDSFEDSLRIAAIAEQGSGRGTSKKTKNGACISVSTSETTKSGESGTVATLYRRVTRGLGLEGHHVLRDGEGGRGSLTCLTLCSRKPLLAGIARGPTRTPVTSYSDDDTDGVSGEYTHGGDTQRLKWPATGSVGVEILVWNYRTRRVLLKHRFGGEDSTDGSGTGIGGGGSAETLPVEDGGETGDAEGGCATAPVAISLHPSGDSIAVAFPHYVYVYYIVGGGVGDGSGEAAAGERSTADVASTMESLSVSLPSLEVARAVALAEPQPLATLRSDQCEVLTKGMFSVAGEQDPVINYDPVSAVHFSPGGHLLAVVTGKVASRTFAGRMLETYLSPYR